MKAICSLLLILAVSKPAVAQVSVDEWKGKEIKVAPVTKEGKALWTISVNEGLAKEGAFSLKGKVVHRDGTEGTLYTCVLTPKGCTIVILDSKEKAWFYKGTLSRDLVFSGTSDRKLAELLEARLARNKGN